MKHVKSEYNLLKTEPLQYMRSPTTMNMDLTKQNVTICIYTACGLNDQL